LICVNVLVQAPQLFDALGLRRWREPQPRAGTLQLGFGTVLSRSAMPNVSREFRVSGNVPNLRPVLGLPIRF